MAGQAVVLPLVLPPPVVERSRARHIRREPVISDRRSPEVDPAVGKSIRL
jgi:hypothetical protein